MSRILKNSYQRAIERADSDDLGSRIRASDDIWGHSELRTDARRVRITAPEFSGTKRAISRTDWNSSLDISRKLYARNGELSGATCQKSSYVIGDAWEPRFEGRDAKWGEESKEWLDYWLPIANIRGEPFDLKESLFTDSIAIDREGDEGMLLCTDGNLPRIQFIPAGQIGFRSGTGQDQNGYGKVPDGIEGGKRFVGMRCYNGVVFNGFGSVVAYGVVGLTPKDDRIFGIDECQLLYEPEWSDQGRGIPKVGNCILTWMDYEDIVHFIKRQVKQDSALGILHYNEEGSAPNPTGADFMRAKDSGAVNQSVFVEQIEGNEIMYMRAEGGGKIEPVKSDRPHPNVDAHNMRLLRGCFLALGWPYELYDPKSVGGASTRLIQDFARASVLRRQRLVWKRFVRIIAHGLSWAMESGDISRNNDADWLKWTVTLPKKVTVDARYDDKTKMEKIRMGAGTHAELFGDEGEDWRPQITQWLVEEKWWQDEAKRIGVDLEKSRIRFPNGTPQPVQMEETKKEDEE